MEPDFDDIQLSLKRDLGIKALPWDTQGLQEAANLHVTAHAKLQKLLHGFSENADKHATLGDLNEAISLLRQEVLASAELGLIQSKMNAHQLKLLVQNLALREAEEAARETPAVRAEGDSPAGCSGE